MTIVKLVEKGAQDGNGGDGEDLKTHKNDKKRRKGGKVAEFPCKSVNQVRTCSPRGNSLKGPKVQAGPRTGDA